MNGPHDMGGFAGFGRVEPEAAEPVFHEPWEARSFALVLAMGMTGAWTIDAARHARERLPPLTYWSSSYHEMRHHALVGQLRSLGLITDLEEQSGRPHAPPPSLARRPHAEDVPAILAAGGPASRPVTRAAAFSEGERVRTRNIHPEGHTRLPRYARGREGEVLIAHGVHVFPDDNATGTDENPQWLYTVRFSARELWGRDGPDTVQIDLFEPYLERIR